MFPPYCLLVKHADTSQLAPKLPTSETPPTAPTFSIGIKVDRKSYSPSLILSSPTVPFTSIPFAYTTGPDASTITSALSTLSYSKTDSAALTSLVNSLWKLFLDSKAYTLYFTQAVLTPRPTLHLPPTNEAVVMHLDPTNPQLPINAYTFHNDLEKNAAPHGIVCHTLQGKGTIGTLVNGAGLAMNTCDVLLRRGGHPANFLDTGGKATGKTVVESFRAVLGDKRVRAIFVNIYGGLTDCVMIAEGILMAYKELDMNSLGLPLVVRLRGTNEKEGQKMVSFFVFALSLAGGLLTEVNSLGIAACRYWRLTTSRTRWRR
jgi:succinyl-CoA synthetase alpha subunit